MSDARRAKTSKASKTSKTSNNLAPAPAGGKRRLASALALTSLTGLTALMLTPAAAQPGAAKEHETPSRPHVYLLRGLMKIFSLGMDQLAAKIAQRGIAASVHNHAEADAIVAQIAAQYRAGDRGPVILIGHSLGADAVMTMAQALNRDGVPVALVIPFDGTGSYVTPKNVACVLNLTQRNYAYICAAAPVSTASSRTSMSAATAASTILRSTSRRGCKRRRSIPCWAR
jgi:Thioesterase domain